MANELLINDLLTVKFEKFHGELLATALYFPIVIPVIVLATSALGLTMAYVYGLVFALAIFAVGIALEPLCKHISIRGIIKKTKVSSAEGAAVVSPPVGPFGAESQANSIGKASSRISISAVIRFHPV
jgi:tellurite resistance protein TehA-like permease